MSHSLPILYLLILLIKMLLVLVALILSMVGVSVNLYIVYSIWTAQYKRTIFDTGRAQAVKP